MSPAIANPKRQAIIKTATAMFMTSGFDGTSMDRLAETVPVSKPTLYKHFSNKEELFVAVMSNRCEGFVEKMVNIPTTVKTIKDIKNILKELALSYLTMLEQPESIKLYRLMMAEAPKFPKLGSAFYEGGPKKGLSLLADAFAALHRKKQMQFKDPWMAANLFFAMLREDGHLRRMLGIKADKKAGHKNKIADYVVEVFIKSHAI